MGKLIPEEYSGSTTDIKIDSYTFTLPTDVADAFLATREMTIAAYRKVTAGEVVAGGGRDMAFVFGTAIIATSEGNSVVEAGSVAELQAHIAGGEVAALPPSDDLDGRWSRG